MKDKLHNSRFGDLRPLINYYFIMGITILSCYLGGIIYDNLSEKYCINKPQSIEENKQNNKLEKELSFSLCNFK